MRTISLTLTLMATLAMAGCSSVPKLLANRLACTADGQRAVVASMYGPIGVVSYVDPADAAALCGALSRSTPSTPSTPKKDTP